MKRPVVLIVGAVAGALLVAGIGASAHTGLFVTKFAGVQSAVFGDESSAARVEEATPEPSETPEPSPTPEPAETPEPADTDTDNDTETNDDNETGSPATTGNHETGDHESGGTSATGTNEKD